MTGGWLRRVDLPGGRVLGVRPERVQDAAAVTALYDGLDPEELYCRFFSAHRPPDSFILRMSGVSERGGAGLVAVVTGPDEVGRVVGEASCEPLPGGDAELGIAVARGFRGWLGPFLLDALIDEARRLGVRNLQAEVLAANRPMLALLRSRGLVILDRSDCPATVRVAIGVTSEVPVWPAPTGSPRVLVELSEQHWPHAPGEASSGLQITCCPGPDGGGPACPALAGRPCPLAEEADVIVVAPRDDPSIARHLLAAHRALHPTRPVYISGWRSALEPDADARILPTDDEEVVGLLRALRRETPHRDLQAPGSESEPHPFPA